MLNPSDAVQSTMGFQPEAQRAIDIFDFIKQLQLKKLFTISQYRFIENIFFYINDLVVYKFVISVNPKMLKKAKKFGLNQPYIIHTNDFEHVKIKPPLNNSSFEASPGLCHETFAKQNINQGKGAYILMYNPNINEITITEGEGYPNF